jgi:hypothetical protein
MGMAVWYWTRDWEVFQPNPKGSWDRMALGRPRLLGAKQSKLAPVRFYWFTALVADARKGFLQFSNHNQLEFWVPETPLLDVDGTW